MTVETTWPDAEHSLSTKPIRSIVRKSVEAIVNKDLSCDALVERYAGHWLQTATASRAMEYKYATRSQLQAIVSSHTMTVTNSGHPAPWIKFTAANRWLLGSQRVLEKLNATDTTVPPFDSNGSTTAWTIDDSTYRLRIQNDAKENEICENVIEPFYPRPDGGGCWSIGDSMICKIQNWSESFKPEAELIELVHEKVKDIPIPKIYAHWVDHKLRRGFMLMERVPGVTLAEVWPRYSETQKNCIVAELVEIITRIGQHRSKHFESIDGKGPIGAIPWLGAIEIDPELGTQRFPRYDGAQYDQAMAERWDSFPYPTTEHALTHGDLHLGNIISSEPGPDPAQPAHIIAIIDWEAAHYAPWWTFPLGSKCHEGFLVPGVENCFEFADKLYDRLVHRYYHLQCFARFVARG